jgi:hypothetical protein
VGTAAKLSRNNKNGMEEETKKMTNLEMAERAFNAYNEAAGGKTWDGRDIPPFSEVGEKVQNNWVEAILAVAKSIAEGQF